MTPSTGALVAVALCISILASVCDSRAEGLSLRIDEVEIPQVDYEPAIYRDPGDPLPHIDFQRVGWDRVVRQRHQRVVLETTYLRVEVLPRMGRVYSMIDRATGHDVLWKNDIVRPGGANNPTGWWLWIGGVEYTLPGYEHGTTFAIPWSWEIAEDSDRRKAVALEVVEPLTGLHERIVLAVTRGQSSLETRIRIHNPGADTVRYAHWVNPMWVPGGRNELTDDTELIIPTRHILVSERWQANLGSSPQLWAESPLRFLRAWKAGDIMADRLRAGYYSAYSHDADEGVVRVFDPLATPGVDVWTYGFHPRNIPMGSGAPNMGYVEMWGGTSRLFPDETRPLGPSESIGWTEWMYPYAGTGGLTAASQVAAARCTLRDGELQIALAPAVELDALLEILVSGRVAVRQTLTLTPGTTMSLRHDLGPAAADGDVLVTIRSGETVVLQSSATVVR